MPTFPSIDEMRARIPYYRNLLSTFTSSPSTFTILHSIPSSPSPTNLSRTLLTLDSSFNPPTLAHAHLLTTALSNSSSSSTSSYTSPESTPTPRILLLLATINADKAPKPASFPERLVMMELFASELLSTLPSHSAPAIDIAVTKHPYFVDKSKSIEESGLYGEGEAEQVHLIGYDTLTRLLDTKYYPPSHNLSTVSLFLEKHRLLVTYRVDDKWGGREEQDGFMETIAEGGLDSVGGRREWIRDGRVRMVEGKSEVVSSTLVREACRMRDGKALKGLVNESVAEWLLEEKLYLEDD